MGHSQILDTFLEVPSKKLFRSCRGPCKEVFGHIKFRAWDFPKSVFFLGEVPRATVSLGLCWGPSICTLPYRVSGTEENQLDRN